MKKLTLKNASFRYVEKSFQEWLDILGYAPTTVKSFPVMIRELLYYMEQQNLTQIHQIDIPIIKTYYKTLSQRENQRLGGGLSNNYLNTHLNAIDLLLEYLRKQARIIIPPTGIPKEIPNPEPITPLTLNQIKTLYATIETYSDEKPAKALRDKAVLSVFYDCGLRRNEGANLKLSDVHFDNRLLEVRKGKGGKPRFVPFGKPTVERLQAYRYDGRPEIVRTPKEDAFLIGDKGQRASGASLSKILYNIQQQTEDSALRERALHLHILRHSIATHLLYQGMSLEKVAQFLGHRSLESTQIYTHLVEKING